MFVKLTVLRLLQQSVYSGAGGALGVAPLFRVVVFKVICSCHAGLIALSGPC